MPRSIDILLVEDNIKDVVYMKERLGMDKLDLRFFTVRSGEEAIDFLDQKPNSVYELMPRPDLVLLDWNLPSIRGSDVIQRIRNDPKLDSIIVVMVTGYPSEEAQCEALKRGAACCIDKPLTLVKFLTIVERVKPCWPTIVRMPD